MALLSGITGFFDKYVLGYAIGTAAGPALEPFVQDLANLGWDANQVRPLAAGIAAAIAAEDVSQLDAMEAEAGLTGYNKDRFDLLYDVTLTAPGMGELLQMARRDKLQPGDFEHGLRKAKLEQRWDAALTDLQNGRLDLGAIATAVHRGIMDDAGLLVTPVPQGAGNVARIPVSTLDTIKEFAAQGIDPERARVLVADTGLPLSLGEMLQLYNRGKVTDTDVKVSIAESNVRNEYMDVALDLARRLLTPHEYAEAELRGVLQHPDAVSGAGLSGITPDDYALLFAILGRPLATHQITTGLARGGKYGGTYDDVPAGPYRDGIRRSAIRPEYAGLDYANRYSYPSGFQIKSEAPDLGFDVVHQLLLEIGWDPKWAEYFATKWSAGKAGGVADPHVTKAQTQLWTTTHSAYKDYGMAQTQAAANLTAIGIPAAAQTEIFTLWDAERASYLHGLSVANINKAYNKGDINEATGQPWTKTEAAAELVQLGYNPAEANQYLDIG